MNLAPIVLFVYNRPEHTLKTLRALENNRLAGDSELIVFADAAPTDASEEMKRRVEEVRAIVNQVWRFKSKELIEREWNWGLADNIIDGVTMVLKRFEKAIVMEDDLLTSPFFLQFMNDGLQVYSTDRRVFSVNAFMFPIDLGEASTFLSPLATSSWGWATWSDRWNLLKTKIPSANILKEDGFIKRRFNFGDYQFSNLLGNKNSWAIHWYYTAFVHNALGVFPTKTLVENLGFDGSGTSIGLHETMNPALNNPIEHSRCEEIDLPKNAKLMEYLSGLAFGNDLSSTIIQRIIRRLRV